MAKKKKKKALPPAPARQVRPESWALIVTGVTTLLLVYAGFASGNWRGVLITEVQVLAVGGTAWFGLRR